MRRAPLFLFMIIALQCGRVVDSVEIKEVAHAQEVDLSWVGEYLSGDAGDNGISLEILESGTFEAWKFACTSDARMSGEWMSDGDWIEFTPLESRVDRGEAEFSALPRMKRVHFQGELVLLPNGDIGLLRAESWRIFDVFTSSGWAARNRFVSEWIVANPLGG